MCAYFTADIPTTLSPLAFALVLCHSSLTPASGTTTPTQKEPVLPGRRQPVSAAAPKAANAPITGTRRTRPRPCLPERNALMAPPVYFCRTVRVTSSVYGSVASLSLFLPVCDNDWPHSVRGASGGNLTPWAPFFPAGLPSGSGTESEQWFYGKENKQYRSKDGEEGYYSQARS